MPMLSHRDFDFIKIIGTGSFGKVFLARLINSNKLFAIKRMDKQLLKENRQLDNIYNEAKILKETNPCAFIVKFYNLIESDSDIFLTMEYVKGGELFYYMKKYCKFPMDAVYFFCCEILVSLKFMHDRAILYRDLKPENILINSDGHTKLADFGFATKLNQNVYVLCGTPEYIAPEKLLGMGDTRETDYWSLGCLIYEMLCGYPPFYSKTTDGIYRKILTSQVVFPDHVVGPVKDLISGLLIKERHDRLGYNGIHEIINHRYFKDTNWKDVEELKLDPPFPPNLYQFQMDNLDTAYNQNNKGGMAPTHIYKRVFKHYKSE